MNDHKPIFRGIAFALATAIVALTFACARWAFSQLGPLEQHLVSSATMPWVDALTLSGARPLDAPVAGDARCATPEFRAAVARTTPGADSFRATCAIEARVQ
jgi:hypothetical protein